MTRKPLTGGEKARASRLRKQAETGEISATDALWLAEFDERAEEGRRHTPKNFGAARSGRKVKFELQEAAESVGTGTAAEAAVMALQSREEGRRLDSLTTASVHALKEACAVYRDVCLSMKERMEVLEGTHIAMLESVREHFLARTAVEAELTQEQTKDGDGANQMLMGLIAGHLGIPLPGNVNGAKKPA